MRAVSDLSPAQNVSEYGYPAQVRLAPHAQVLLDRSITRTAVVHVHGELDWGSAEPLREVIDDELAHGCDTLIVDLSKADFVGIGVISTLNEARLHAMLTTTRFQLACARQTQRLLNVAGAAQWFDTCSPDEIEHRGSMGLPV